MTKKEKEYVLNLSEDANAFIRFNTKEGIVDEFVVKLLFFSRNEWHEILRYDSGHDCPHKDIQAAMLSKKYGMTFSTMARH